MTDYQKNDLLYVCSMIEYVARKTKNHRKNIVLSLGEEGLKHQLKVANVNHSLSFEQVSDEWIEDYKIEAGNFDTISNCKYSIPTETSIGSVYQTLILLISNEDNLVEQIINVFSSFISDEISNFNSDLYYVNPNYIKCSYESGELLA